MTIFKDLKIKLFDDKEVLRLRAFAKHFEALANELDAIDNAEPCVECGSINHTESNLYDGNNEEPVLSVKQCDDCGHSVESSTHLEGTD